MVNILALQAHSGDFREDEQQPVQQVRRKRLATRGLQDENLVDEELFDRALHHGYEHLDEALQFPALIAHDHMHDVASLKHTLLIKPPRPLILQFLLCVLRVLFAQERKPLLLERHRARFCGVNVRLCVGCCAIHILVSNVILGTTPLLLLEIRRIILLLVKDAGILCIRTLLLDGAPRPIRCFCGAFAPMLLQVLLPLLHFLAES